MKFGIYTLANDVVYDQLVALLNSIEMNISPNIPICIIPYDQRLKLVKAEIPTRPNVTLFSDETSIQRWDDFATQVWNSHPRTKENSQPTIQWNTKNNLFRKMCAFDGEFEKFVFYDADSLAMSNLDRVWQKLEEFDFVFDDWEHTKPEEKAAFNLSLVKEKTSLSEREIRNQIHCSSFFGSKQGIFNVEETEKLKKQLIEDQEVKWINNLAWWCDADLFSYMTFKSQRPVFNFTLSLDGKDRTGNCANADPFVNINNVLYNQQDLKQIHRLHYMGYSAIAFTRLSRGEDVDIRYRDEFLHYRFLKQPDKKPKQLKLPNFATKTNRFFQKAVNKVKKTGLLKNAKS